jgi:oligopeptide/dipeptide ABC transporter ATP-binding protein
MSLLEVTGLIKHFRVRGATRPLVAVNGISFSVAPGETFALVGESGSGKTTVGRIVIGLETATDGSVCFEGRDVAHATPRQRRRLAREMQVVFQDPGDSLDPRMTIGDTVAEPLLFSDLSTEELEVGVQRSIARVGLPPEVVDRHPHELSGGAQQKVALARALVGEPKLVVLDEPTSALDVRARHELLAVLARMRNETGLAIIFISHDLTAVRGIADRTGVMYLGEIVETGATRAIFDSPRHPYTRALLAAVPEPDPSRAGRKRIRLRGEIPSPIDLPAGCYLSSRCPRAVQACATNHPPLAPSGGQQLVACLLEQPTSVHFAPDAPFVRAQRPIAGRPRTRDTHPGTDPLPVTASSPNDRTSGGDGP